MSGVVASAACDVLAEAQLLVTYPEGAAKTLERDALCSSGFRLRPREIGRVEARAKQGLRPTDALKGPHNVQREWDEPFVIEV